MILPPRQGSMMSPSRQGSASPFQRQGSAVSVDETAKENHGSNSSKFAAIRHLLSSPHMQATPHIEWNRLGLSTESSPALRKLISTPKEPSSDAHEEQSAAEFAASMINRAVHHRSTLQSNYDTFIAYR